MPVWGFLCSFFHSFLTGMVCPHPHTAWGGEEEHSYQPGVIFSLHSHGEEHCAS